MLLPMGVAPTTRAACGAQVFDSRSPARRLKVSESMALDPLISFFEFGRIRCEDEAPLDRVPCVRFGARSSSRPTNDMDDADVMEAVRY